MDTLADYRNIDRLLHEPARYVVAAHLYALAEADFVFLLRMSGLSAGNLSSHMSKLEDAGYVNVTKSFVERRPQTTFSLTTKGRKAFEEYRRTIIRIMQWGGKS
jgi:DNA-binding MarR family transcriptional regulator